MKLSLKEQKILWIILNHAQHLGLLNVKNVLTINNFGKHKEITDKILSDWIKQTQEEYDIINNLKAKLCGDLE